MELNLRAMLLGENGKLRFINRFSTCHVVHKESVAEHSFYVAFYAQLIARWAEENHGISIDWRVLMERAMVHDLDEARTGDFYRPFKYSEPELRTMLEKAAGRAFQETILPIFEGPGADDHVDGLCAAWENAKATDVEGAIVAFCDFLSVLSYMTLELQVANSTMKEHAETMQQYVASFRLPHYRFLWPLVYQAQELTDLLTSKGEGC